MITVFNVPVVLAFVFFVIDSSRTAYDVLRLSAQYQHDSAQVAALEHTLNRQVAQIKALHEDPVRYTREAASRVGVVPDNTRIYRFDDADASAAQTGDAQGDPTP